ncbi:MAG: protein kinase, partial [Candidatus Acidiferrum sp.]
MSEAWKTWEGQAVDGFPLQQYLGGSDHSAVYLTQLNNSSAQKAAIKFVPADAAADAQMARWRVAGELTHAHLLQLVRVGRCQMANTSFLYVVMEYAEEDLSQILPQRALEPEETRQIVESVLDALTYLHGQGLAHTRIKPGNILATGDQLKISSDTLCEIGGAPLVRPETSIYTAPESASAPVSTAADVWSLGVTVVETLTQRTPVIRSQTRTEFPVPESIPPPYLEIARRCAQLDPARRATLKEISGLLNPGTA